MFMFIEGGPLNFDLGNNIETIEINVTTSLSYNAAIKLLAMYSKSLTPRMVILYNYFTIGCTKFTSAQRRGLERLALGDNAIEIINSEVRQTRFMNTMPASSIRTSVGILRAMMADLISFGIGNFSQGNILIVGESPGPGSQGFNTPFVGSGSGQWLSKQLEAADIDETKLYWINAFDGYGVPASQEFIRTLKPSKIILLGGEARQWAAPLQKDYKVEHIHHPQYWLRFKANEEYPLMKLLK
jgi:hypothetical protein